MQARDASGRQVSLLNDSSSSFAPPRPLSFQSSTHAFIGSGSLLSSPHTPELQRSDSYDSQMSNELISPRTPSDYYARQSAYSIPYEYSADGPPAKRPAYADSSRSTSFDEDMSNTASTSPLSDRPGKRYPCRYRDTHGCEKTFTTSGHASRHSKIHTAEKAVQCTYPGCQKKFTRADNMKQHLETHYKDKSRSSASARGNKTTLAEARRNSSSSAHSSGSSRSASARDSKAQWVTSDQYPLASPNPASGSWEMSGLTLPLLNRPVGGRTPSGLDALAMAVACQDRA
ncbi:hypothetical protein G7046_g6265 [Stylonectria norvegica]|nr:hypothetical protein G7046_g6265 [Stylonectria norvegica]